MNISTEHSLWFIPLCILLAAGYAYLLYGKENRSNRTFGKKTRYALAAARFILVFILSFLLLNPLLKTITEERDAPLFLVAADASESMNLNADSSFVKEELPQKTQNLIAELENDYRVDYVEFGSSVRTSKTDSFGDVHTDFEQLFDLINDQYIFSNLGGVVLISDGLYNRGRNPLYYPFDKPVRFYTIGAGDTTARRDVAVKRIAHNDITFYENNFPVEIDLSAVGCKGEDVEVGIYREGKQLSTQEVTFKDDDEFETLRFELEAQETGIIRYTVKVTQLEDELIYENNERVFYIEVIDNRNKILLLGGTPHPDMGAFHRALKSVKTYETNTKILANNTNTPDLSEYSLVIAFHLGDKKYNGVIQNLKDADVPVLWKFGINDDVNVIRNAVSGLSITSYRRNNNDVAPAFSGAFNLFTFNQKHAEVLENVPPVRLALADYKIEGGLSALTVQKVGKVKTNQPLIAFSTGNTEKSGVVLGDGYFRWRLHNYAQESNTEAFDELIRKSASYLMTMEDKSRFRVEYDKRASVAEPVVLRAELYNPSYELVNTPEVTVTFIDEDGQNKEFTFSRNGERYILNRGIMPPGEYTFEAETELGEESFSKSGAFTVEDVSLESEETKANFNLLRNLADQSGGAFFRARETDQLHDYIKTESSPQTILRERTEFSDVIELRWLFFVLLAFVSFEWLTRKYSGGY